MLRQFRKHRIVATLLGALLTLGAIEGILVFYYLSSWDTLPSL
jgi:hypothetical protein